MSLAPSILVEAVLDALPATVLPTELRASLPAATTQQLGGCTLASPADWVAGTDTERILTPDIIGAREAATNIMGCARLATPAEMAAGTLATACVSVGALDALRADTEGAGLARFANGAEVNAATPPLHVLVSPATLKNWTGLPVDATTSVAGLVRHASSGDMQQTDPSPPEHGVTVGVLADRVANEERAGFVQFASQSEVNAGSSAAKAVAPQTLAAWSDLPPAADTNTAGLVLLADTATTLAGTDTTRAVTAAGLHALALAGTASEVTHGLVRLASQTETNAGLIEDAAVTAATLYSYAGRPAPAQVSTESVVAGLVRLGSQTEVDTGTDPAAAVTIGTFQAWANLPRPAATDASGTVQIADETETNAGESAAKIVTPYTLKQFAGAGGSPYMWFAEDTDNDRVVSFSVPAALLVPTKSVLVAHFDVRFSYGSGAKHLDLYLGVTSGGTSSGRNNRASRANIINGTHFVAGWADAVVYTVTAASGSNVTVEARVNDQAGGTPASLPSSEVRVALSLFRLQ